MARPNRQPAEWADRASIKLLRSAAIRRKLDTAAAETGRA
jgi:hypothetical protein